MSQLVSFYRICDCSLLSVRPHPVTSRTDWARHLAVREQDQLDDLFEGGIYRDESTENEAVTRVDESSDDNLEPWPIQEDSESDIDYGNIAIQDEESTDDQRPHTGGQGTRQERLVSDDERLSTDEEYKSNGSEDLQLPITNDHSDVSGVWDAQPMMQVDSDMEVLPEMGGPYESSVKDDHDFDDPPSSPPRRNTVDETRSSDPELFNEQESSEVGSYRSLEGGNSGDLVGEKVERRDSFSSEREPSQEYHQFPYPETLELGQEKGGSDPDPIIFPITDDNETSYDEQPPDAGISDASEFDGVLNDRVGQMRRGFVDPNSSDGTSGGSSSEDGFSEANGDSFVYGDKKPTLSMEEIISVSIHDLKLSHRLSREACTDFTALLESVASGDNSHCWDYRTTKKWIQGQTGVQAISYDCCKNSCMSFSMYPEKEACDYCQHPRWKELQLKSGERKPIATHEYIPITHRLRLWYSDPARAASMINYRLQAERAGSSSHQFW